jgi:CheY-like chemotaxis protein
MNPQSIPSLPPPAPRLRILCVDDDPAPRRLAARVLQAAGHEVDTCEHGAEAWTLLQHQSYHLLITDNQMPELTGLELIRRIRLAGMTIPIVLVSAVIDAFSSEELQWLPCGTTLGKPFAPAQLISSVRKALETAPKLQPAVAHHRSASAEMADFVRPHSQWGINE